MDTVNLQNVLLEIEPIRRCFILEADGSEGGTSEGPARGNWRKLRGSLPNLFLTDDYNREEIAHWLNEAGYVAALRKGFGPFTAELVTEQVEKRVYHWAYLISWSWASFRRDSLRPLIRRVDRYRGARDKGYIAPTTRLFRDLGTDETLNFREWEPFLKGLATSESIPGRLALHEDGRPVMAITPDSPMHAIVLTIFLDRVLTRRKLSQCKWCRHKFVARTQGQMFCPPTKRGASHQSLWKTRFRRDKVKATREAMKKVGKNWKKVAALASKKMKASYPKEPRSKLLVTSEWAKNEMMKGANNQ